MKKQRALLQKLAEGRGWQIAGIYRENESTCELTINRYWSRTWGIYWRIQSVLIQLGFTYEIKK
jgi:hypothetical protein